MAVLLLILLLAGVCVGWRTRARAGQKCFRYEKMEAEIDALRQAATQEERVS